MLDQSLSELAIASCFSSQRLSDQLKQALAKTASIDLLDKKNFHARCREALRLDLDNDNPRRFRWNDIDVALNLVWPSGMLIGTQGDKFPAFDQMLDRLFIADGDHLHYRDGQVQEYVRMATRLDPAILVSWHFAQKTRQANVNTHDLIRWVEAQQAFFAPVPIPSHDYADNHVHVGGVYQTGIALLYGLLDDKTPIVNKRKHETKDAFRSLKNLALGLLWEGDLSSLNLPIEDRVGQGICTRQNAIQTLIQNALGAQSATQAARKLNWDSLAQQNETAAVNNPRWLRQQMARSIATKHMGRAWLWFLIWLWTHYQDPECHPRLRTAIFYLISGLNIVRRDLIMEGQGLSRFVEYYDRPRRDDSSMKEPATIDAANTLFQGSNDVAELKVSPSKLNPRDIGEWLLQLAKATGTPAPHGLKPLAPHELMKYRDMMERWHYCVHFFRSKEFLFSSQKAWEEARKLDRQHNTQAGWHRANLLNDSTYAELSEHEQFKLVPSRWLRGLDVAGDENLTKTEIYAPALRWLREGLSAKAVQEPPSKGLHFSIHCGEDYPHPLSGMRHIDETVRFCEMRSGDRLGHALALGISAKQWIKAQGEILLTVEEHLDNLVWAWHHASHLSDRLPLAKQVLHVFERKILKFVAYIPWLHPSCATIAQENHETKDCLQGDLCASHQNLLSITPDVLFDAWSLRRNCFHQLGEYEDKGRIPTPELRVGVPDIALLTRTNINKSIENQTDPVAIYRHRWRWRKLHHNAKQNTSQGCQRISPMKTVRLRLESDCQCDAQPKLGTHEYKELIEDTHTAQELEFMDALQDWLLDSYDCKGLMIEVNPTSNVSIARMSKHADHPVFRWNPPNENWLKSGKRYNKFGLRRGPMRVCINTDDPGIMPTTLRTEFSLLLEAAMEHGVSRTVAENWLESLRVQGLNTFRKNHQSVWQMKNNS